MKAYPAYKDSGVEWLGMVPEGWATTQLKRFATMTYGDALASETRDDDGGIPVYGSNGPVGWHSIGNALAPVILIGRKGSFGALNWSDRACFAIDTVYFVDCRSASCNLRWLYWAMHNANFDALSQDTGVPGLSRASAHDTWFALPPLPEQQAIAAFLDRETAKIDGLIEEQRRLIALLAEKRQATISHAVTRGLNPSARLKPSGVDWLGDVPEGWEVVPLSAYFRASKGPRGQMLTKEYCGANEGGFPVYSGQTDSNGVMGFVADYDFDVGENGVLFSTTVGAKAMTVSLVVGKFSLSQNCMIIVPLSKEILSSFYLYHFTPLFAYFRGMIPEHMQASFRMADLYKFKIALPTFEEQYHIANHLHAFLREQAALTETATTAIALLQERRAALISAAVTGKIDVRDTFPREAA